MGCEGLVGSSVRDTCLVYCRRSLRLWLRLMLFVSRLCCVVRLG